MFRTVQKLGEFVKFSHTVFALPFALAAMALAARDNRGWPGWEKFALIVGCMVTARTCAMAFNRIVDRQWDARNPRTSNRHLPSGQISLASAWTLCLLSAVGFLTLCWFINLLCFLLSPVILVVICFYSLTKRFTDFTHVFLGIALGLAPLGAWIAVRGEIAWQPWRLSFIFPLLLSLIVFFWLIGFDIIYAIQDYEFDRRAGLHSLVVRWGVKNALEAAFLSHLVMWGLLVLFGLLNRFRMAYFPGAFIILIALLFEHWLARRRSIQWINLAFFRLNAVISMVFMVVTVAEVVFPDFFRLRR